MAPSRVTKKRSDSTKQQHPIQFWDGKTYACLACKRGHRVKLCDHGKDGKLVSATNQPGRPSSGSDRKCTCPKSCKCTTNCKCVKQGCICVQQMFLVVALKSRPKPVWVDQDPEPIPQWIDEHGEQKTLNPVYTDLNGNILSADEARAREEEKERRRNDEVNPPKKSACCTSRQLKEETSPVPSAGCRHRETIPLIPAPEKTEVSIPSNAASKCTCGVKCQCTLCPEHPNNTTTQQYNAQQLNAMASNTTYMPTQSMINGQLYKPEIPQGSCLGGEATYFLTREQPTLDDFQRLFPNYAPGDFVLTYPMDAPTHSYNQMNNFNDIAYPAAATQMPMGMPMDDLSGFQPLTDNGIEDVAFMNQPLDFTFGDADVTTFGSQPLQSPSILQSPAHRQNLSGPPEMHTVSHMVPSNIGTPQTISTNVLEARPSYFPPAHPPSQPIPSGMHAENKAHNLFFDDDLPILPEDAQFDMAATTSRLHNAHVFDYPHCHPLTSTMSSPAP